MISMLTASQIDRIDSSDDASRGLAADALGARAMRATALFFLILVVIAAPAFFGQHFHDAEEQVSLFGAAYGPRLFYPGSNRILAVLPFLTSWIGTPHLIGIGYFVITVCCASGALALFAYFLPRAMFYAYSVFLFLLIVVFLGGGIYQFRFNTVHPYLIPFSLSIACCTLFLNVWPTKNLLRLIFVIILTILTMAEAGMNPSAALLSLTFLTLYLTATYVGRIVRGRASLSAAIQEGVQCLGKQKGPVLGIFLNAVAMASTLLLSAWYKNNFPQYVKSNYSVESYINSGLSFRAVWRAFVFLTDFHDRSGIFGIAVSNSLIAAALLSGFLGLGLWLARRHSNSLLSRYYLASFLIWISSIITIVVLAQSAHVQLVQNMIQGRYYTTPYYGILLSACLTCAAASVDFAPWAFSGSWRSGDKAWLAGGVILAIACVLADISRWGTPQIDIALRHPSYVALAETIQAARVPVVLGSYWWIWELQYEFNRDVTDTPRVTPVSIRAESFGLNAFMPLVHALAGSKSFRFACIELRNRSPGDNGCGQQIEFYQILGGFPLGRIHKLSQHDFDGYKITIYEQRLKNSEDSADCTESQVSLRAKQLPSSSEESSYDLDEESFVYLQKPADSAQWSLTFKNNSGEREITVPRGSQAELQLLQHTVGVMSSGCRLLVTLSRRERLFPGVTRLIVRQ